MELPQDIITLIAKLYVDVNTYFIACRVSTEWYRLDTEMKPFQNNVIAEHLPI
jgi:hypothetical protein